MEVAEISINSRAEAQSSSFEAEMLPHRSALFQAACSLTRSRAEAEDAVQETYLQAWKSRAVFQPGTNCRAWLFTILVNKVRNCRRKWIFRFQFVEDQTMFEQSAAWARSQVEDELTDPDILEALKRLTLAQAQAVVLADVHELSYKDISESVGCPIGTIMSRISRGRDLLRSHLANEAMKRGMARWIAESSLKEK